MKKVKSSILFIALFSVAISAGLYGCAKKQSVSPKVIASVNGNPITLPMLKNEMSKFPSALRVYLETPSGEKRLLKSLVDRQVLVNEALKKGINESKAYRAKVLDFKKGLLVQMLLHEEIKNKVADVTVADAKVYYKKHYLNFNVPSKINADYIQTKSLKQAELAYKMLKNGKPFSVVAQKYSIAPNAKKGGVLGWIKFQETTPAFNNAAFSIPKVGDISRIVKVGNSFDIIKLKGIIAGKSKPFSAIKNEIMITMKQKSASKILRNFVKKLRAKSKIKYFYNNLPLAGPNNKKKAAPAVGKKQG